MLPYIEVDSSQTATAAVIWLHGLGADGHDFASVVPDLNLPKNQNVRFLFPHAPVMPVTLNGGMIMPAWFDIHGLTRDAKTDRAGVLRTLSEIQMLIQQEVSRGIPAHRIFIAGFSQGAAMALVTGLMHDKPLGGVIALSGFLPAKNDLLAEVTDANRHIPIFIAHGTADTVVSFALGKLTKIALEQAGHPVEWHEYPIAHTVNKETLNDIGQWLSNQLNK